MSGPGRTARYGYTEKKRVEFTSEYLDEVDYNQVGPSEYVCPKIPNYSADEDEGYLQLIPLATPLPIPQGASLDTALRIYKRCETGWHKSNACTELKKVFHRRITREIPRITKCICFGLGSPTTISRSNVSMYQLAAFKTVFDILTTQQNQGPSAFVQEPVLNTLDKQLLHHLNISVVNHPAGFHHINATTFVFCPSPPYSIVRGVLSHLPPVFMNQGPLETYRDPETGQLSCNLKTSFPEMDPDQQHLSPAQIRERKRRNAIKGALLIERFKKGKEGIELPDLCGGRSGGWVFQDTHIFWTSPGVARTR